MKIVYNDCYGGFGLSEAGWRRYCELAKIPFVKNDDLFGENYSTYDIDRSDPLLVQVVEELGDAASGRFAQLRIEEIEAGQCYRIDEYDGIESVMTIDNYKWKVAK